MHASSAVLFAAIAVAVVCATRPTVDMATIRAINAAQSTWRAAPNRLTAQPRETTRRLLGISAAVFHAHAEHVAATHRTAAARVRDDIPAAFDARERWPQCRGVIETVRDQGHCGSCWAFGAAEAMSDRECIHNGRVHLYSTQELTACANDTRAMCGGCTGGLPWCAWRYWTVYGLVAEECAPYNVSVRKTPECVRECVRGSGRSWLRDRLYGATSESFVGEQAMQAEIMQNGPVEGMMLIFEDLYAYRTGIYRHVKGGVAGAHAIKIVGWGVENSTKYWTVANSWGRDWGEDGFFRIVRGKQECGIETDSFAGLPRPVV